MSTKSVPFVTEDGATFELVDVRQVTLELAAAAVERDFRARGEMVDAPTYQVKALGGEVMTLPLEPPMDAQVDEAGNVTRPARPGNLDVPKDPDATALRHSMWDQYQRTLWRMHMAQVKARYEALIYLGFRVDMPDGDEWMEEEVALGIEPPKSGKERKLRYITCHLCNERDVTRAVSVLQVLQSGIGASEEKIAEYEAMFRTSLQGSAAQGIDEALATLRRVVGEEPLRGADGGAEVGSEVPE